ncbi:MAG: hypothetical protein Q8873_00075 [Bacillota bacterium]|nr:hypothetical protein [Bacillota bacterium]
MPKTTTNYSFKKPLYSENADVAVLNENMDVLDDILTPTVSSNIPPPTVSKGKVSEVLGWIANRIKAITGQSSWYTDPSVTLEDCKAHMQSGSHTNATVAAAGFMSAADKQKLDYATNEYTSSRLMIRDSNGRAKVQAPSDSYDIANKSYVDNNFVPKNTASTLNAVLTAYSNTSYTTKQVRNIVIWTSGDTPPSTSNGDIVIKVF